MTRYASLVVLALFVCLTGCSLQHAIDKIAPETVQHAKTNFDYLRHKQFDLIEPSLGPTIDRDTVRDKLTEMAALIPAQEPISEKTVGAYFQCSIGKWCDYRATLEYQFPAQWMLVEFIERKQDGKYTISSFHVTQEPQSLETANRFTLFGKEPLQYAILGASIGSLAIMLYALILCIRTPIRKRKWLWVVLILLGICKIGVNWTTGEAFHQIFFLAILPFGFARELYGPWFIYVSLPLGSLLFLAFRSRIRKQEAPTPPAANLPQVSPDSMPPILE
jgi:hypothetical protein